MSNTNTTYRLLVWEEFDASLYSSYATIVLTEAVSEGGALRCVYATCERKDSSRLRSQMDGDSSVAGYKTDY
jgi:hypothetical protein